MVVITRLKLFIFVFVSLVCVVEVFIIEDEYASVRGLGPKRRSKKLLNARNLLWRHAAVIYKVDDSLGCPDSWRCFLIMEAMHQYTEKTCVRFQQWTGENDVVIIKQADLDGGGGGADRGKVGGEQRILISHSYYWTMPILLHELGHTLSLHDEHMRPDRYKFLEVLWDNIRPECFKYFRNMKREDINLLGEPFDPDSIMMYDDEACAMIPGEQTLRLKSGQPITRSQNLSPGDVRRIQDLYRCEGTDQKPSFPRDVFCDFGSNSCGFNGLNTDTWKWIRYDNGLGGYLASRLMQVKDSASLISSETWSVNFHGLSPLDEERGPDGCISFMYLFETSQAGLLSLKLYKVELNSPLDLEFRSERAVEIWSEDSSIKLWQRGSRSRGKWRHASVRINVKKPFMLRFVSEFNACLVGDSVKVDQFSVSFKRSKKCKYPTDINVRSRNNSSSEPGNGPLRASCPSDSSSSSSKSSSKSFLKSISKSLSKSLSKSFSKLLSKSSPKVFPKSSPRSSSKSSPISSPKLSPESSSKSSTRNFQSSSFSDTFLNWH